jgi:hypothetical protein
MAISARARRTKTERSRRTLGLPAVAVQALRALRETQAEERLTAGDNWQDTGLVFTTHRGAALDVGNASTRTTEIVYRRELRPVITTGAEIMDQLFTGTQAPAPGPNSAEDLHRPAADPWLPMELDQRAMAGEGAAEEALEGLRIVWLGCWSFRQIVTPERWSPSTGTSSITPSSASSPR